MKKIISNIPNRVRAKYTENKIIYTSYGVIATGLPQLVNGISVEKFPEPNLFYVEVEDEGLTLVLKYVAAESTEDTIVFNGVEFGRYTYNPKYKELSLVSEDILGIFRCRDGVDDKRMKILSAIVNEEVFLEYVSNMVVNDSYYLRYIEEGIMSFNAEVMFSLYLSKVNKAFGLLLDNELKHEISYLMENGVEYDEFGYEINSKTIRLARNLRSVAKSGVVLSARLLTRFNFNEIENLMKIADYFKFSSLDFWNTIFEIDVNLGEFSEYLIKSIFVNDNLSYKRFNSRGAKTLKDSVVDWTIMYKDYLNMKEVNDPMYPDDLKDAHDLATDIYEKKKRDRIEAERMEAFIQNVNTYRNLCWEKDEFKIIVPETPGDLTVEGRKMGHCVGGYIGNVASGRSKILFIRKDDEPYITIECREDRIIQAKKYRNERPNPDDEKLIYEWAEIKGLEVSSY